MKNLWIGIGWGLVFSTPFWLVGAALWWLL